jgi:hypothetical protein
VEESSSLNTWASSNSFAALPGSGAEVPTPSTKTAKPSGSTFTTVASSTSKRDVPGAASAEQTKKQRQNAARAQAKKAEKEAMEAERLSKLAQHKRQVEAERMKDHYKKQAGPSSAPFSTPGPKQKSLPKATINEKGSLVWD